MNARIAPRRSIVLVLAIAALGTMTAVVASAASSAPAAPKVLLNSALDSTRRPARSRFRS